MATTYQDVLRANGVLASWALAEAAGTDFAPWVGGTHIAGGGTLSYRQAGPFATAFAVHLAAGASMRWPEVTHFTSPCTNECWFKLSSVAPSPYELLLRDGTTAASGTGIYVATDHHVHFTSFGGTDFDTGFLWPDTAWHLLDWVSPGGLGTVLYLDGQMFFNGNVTNTTVVNNTAFGYGCDATADNSKIAIDIAYPAVYSIALSSANVYANFLAATDPVSALGLTASGGGAVGALNAATLDELVGYVSKTYQNTP